jgi:SAM-dependent MidA family methyltransferase
LFCKDEKSDSGIRFYRQIIEKDRQGVAIGARAKYIVGIVRNKVTSKQDLNIIAKHLPQPEAASQAHSERVRAYIRNAIDDAGGSIGFAEFMQHALYANGLGYYSAGATKFGEAGDFVTAPEISPLFGKVLANQVAVVLEQITDNGNRTVLEIGAGSGALAIQVLQRLEALGSLPSRYCILEVSADLQQRQRAAIASALPHLADRVEWLSGWPDSFSGAVVANEVLDAMPVERFVKGDGQVYRRAVTASDEGFAWTTEPAPDLLAAAVHEIETDLGLELADGYESEVSLGAGDWLTGLAECMELGFAFLFDYGVSQREYYAADRSGGWLQCYFRHHAHSDPLIYPGIQDLTAWVNFSQVARTAYDGGLHIAGYVSQAQFLLLGGLPQELENIAGLPTAAQIALSRQVKLLTMPGEMGENFKCMGLSKGAIEAPELFALADRAHTL